jgi:hypothetical protein
LLILFYASVPPIEIVIDGADNINLGELTHARLPKGHSISESSSGLTGLARKSSIPAF